MILKFKKKSVIFLYFYSVFLVAIIMFFFENTLCGIFCSAPVLYIGIWTDTLVTGHFSILGKFGSVAELLDWSSQC